MEQILPVITKRVWSTVRAVLFMLTKGFLSKKKFMLHPNMNLKRGIIAIGNLMFHHRQVSSSTAAVQEYEFSCSNTPNHFFPFNLKKKNTNSINNYYPQLFACVHAPPTHDEDNLATMNAVKAVLDMLSNNDNTASPMLPGFGQSPLARQLRDGDEDNSYVDKAAEDFINRFYKDLKLQNKILSDS